MHAFLAFPPDWLNIQNHWHFPCEPQWWGLILLGGAEGCKWMEHYCYLSFEEASPVTTCG